MAAIGIKHEAILRPREDIAPSHCHHMADTVIILDDDCTNKNKNGKETIDGHVESKSEDAKNEGCVDNLQLTANPQSWKERAVKKQYKKNKPRSKKEL